MTTGGLAPSAPARGRDLLPLVFWLVLSVVIGAVAAQNARAPGLNYDEAVYGHLCRDFLEGRRGGEHLPGSKVVELFGRPFPVSVQGYLGALKCFMLLPGLSTFGCGVGALRFTMLAWSLLALLLFILWARRVLGTVPALLAGGLLGLDPAVFFPSVCEWGAFVPSLVCRMAAFLCAWLFFAQRKARWLFLAGLAAGLGLLNKLDFTLILGGVLLAGVLVYGRTIVAAAIERPRAFAGAALGLALGFAPLLLNTEGLTAAFERASTWDGAGESGEKWNTLRAVLDGSYFRRLMDHGGVFERMYDAPSATWTPFGLVFAAAFLLLSGVAVARLVRRSGDRLPAFLALAGALVAAGTWFLPGAVRVHHWTLFFPFPQLMVAWALQWIWRQSRRPGAARLALRGLAVSVAAILLAADLVAIRQTERVVAETGGKGYWSGAFDGFAAEVRDRSDLTIVSTDWGFQEQLAYLTDGPRLVEAVWQMQAGARLPVVPSVHTIYLVRPGEYALFPFGADLLRMAASMPPGQARVREYRDRQGCVDFYAVTFLAAPSDSPR